MYETLIIALFLIILNIIFGLKPHPIFGISIAMLTFFVGVFYFVTDTTLPMNYPNPIFTIIVLFIAGLNAICQVMDYRKPY
jgi:hypothetical protein